MAASSNNYFKNSSAFGRDSLGSTSILVENIIVRKMKQKILVITLCFVIAFLHPHDLVAAASTYGLHQGDLVAQISFLIRSFCTT